MKGSAFTYTRAVDADDALARSSVPASTYLAGGTDLLQLWKIGRSSPEHVVDISRLEFADVTDVDGCLRIGALARLHDVATDTVVAERHPLLTEAILASASGHLRHMATVGGNLLQRTRCPYFRTSGMACNKARPGTGCGARSGDSRHAALFGASASCVATHPSDLSVALMALDAEVAVASFGSPDPEWIALADLYRLPGDSPERDTTLVDGALVTELRVRHGARFAAHSTYVKVRDRASFEFALVSVGAAFTLDDGLISDARLAAGGVAPMPWRLRESEAALIGRVPDVAAFDVAAEIAIDGAQPLPDNGFKVELLRRSVVRALTTAATIRS